MLIGYWVIGSLIVCFSFVLLVRGAPFLPTHNAQIEKALDMLELQPGQLLLELGCGDGRVLRAAASRGLRAYGIELNPLLAIYCRVRCWRQRRLITIKWGNFYSTKWPKADGIFVFYLQKYMPELDKLIIQKTSWPLRLVSYAFTIPGKKAVIKKDALALYKYR